MEDNGKRIMIAFAVSFTILMVWRFAFPPPEPPASPTTPPALETPAAPATDSPAPEADSPSAYSASSSASAKPKPAEPVALPVLEGSQAEEIVVENDVARVTFSTEGAVVNSWVLKEYKDEKGQPLDLVNPVAAKSLGFPLSLKLASADDTKKVNAALYVASPAEKETHGPGKLELSYSDGNLRVQKILTFGAGYDLSVEVSVFDGERHFPVEVSWPAGLGDHSLPPERALHADQAIYRALDDDKTHAETLTPSFFGKFFSKESDASKGQLRVSVPVAFAGLGDRYFAGIFFPESSGTSFRAERQPWTPVDWNGEEEKRPTSISAWLASMTPEPLAFRMFVGPKDLDLLRNAKPSLESLVDFGWFSFVARPLFIGMHYINDHWTHNFGWAIILLTVLINTALFPMKLKQIRSGQEMQRVGPLIKSIQEKYKGYKINDPRREKMNQEMMKLYKEHNINPLSGCLPMLVQLPFFYGFYRVLDLSIELRHAPWILWIHDLSARDPHYILPVVMTATMFLVQRMTPMAMGDPAQQRMMMFMPLVFGFMFINFASGLVLYWLTGNVVAIGQQLLINKFLIKPKPPAGAATGNLQPKRS